MIRKSFVSCLPTTSFVMDVCRVCLSKCTRTRNSRKLIEKAPDGVPYFEMFQRIAQISSGIDEILCSICCSDLVLCYKFLLKVDEANKIWISNDKSTISYTPQGQSDTFSTAEIVKDPLEDSEDESLSNDGKFQGFLMESDIKIEDQMELKKDSFDTTIDSESLKNDDNHSNILKVCQEREALLNDLSDLSVSAENLIFPRGYLMCKLCDKTYFTSAGLIAHQEVHMPKNHAAKKKRLRCAQKRRIPKNAFELETLIGPHSDMSRKESYTLTETDDPQSNEGRIEQKSPKIKKLKPKKMFPCQVCGKLMISASKLRYHMVMHTGEKDFLCSICPKAYSTIYALKHHFRSHTGDRPYTCTFCGDRFLRPTTLKSHVRRHTGERPYGCDVCGKRFIQHSSMTTHMKLNHMAKTIPCPHCDKKYARQTDLNTHMLSHTGDKPFRCQLCPSRFIRQANLNKHMNQHHSAKTSILQKPNRIEKCENFVIEKTEQEQEVIV